MSRRVFRLLVAVAALALTMPSAVAYAQGASTAPLSGVVVDKDGGVMPGVTVVAKDNATGTNLPSVVTNSAGIFNFPSMNPGTYTVTMWHESFQITRAAGKLVLWEYLCTTIGNGNFGLSNAVDSGINYGFSTTDGALLAALEDGAGKGTLLTLVNGTAYTLAIVLRANGAYWFVKMGGAWTLKRFGNASRRSKNVGRASWQAR